ncbi:MAG: hypothetical protein LUD39_04625 [Opitutae bacterium]|nr:hypothetical protein [Opitutae bacterium]MCD8299024.1 hypothetical protein [Opitutae bacterium]
MQNSKKCVRDEAAPLPRKRNFPLTQRAFRHFLSPDFRRLLPYFNG